MKRVLAAAAAVAALGALALVPGGAGARSAPDGTTLLHGIPGTPVDVYVDGTATFVNFQPGTTQDLTSLAGQTLVDIEIFAAGADAATATPLLTAASLAVPATGNHSVVVHNDEAGAPKITVFVNNGTETGPGVGRLTVRHAAAAPAVDLVLAADRPVTNLVNGGSQELAPVVGNYAAQLAEAGAAVIAGTEVIVEVKEGENLIVYAVGSLTGGIEYYTQMLAVGVLPGQTTTTDPNATTTTTIASATTTTDPNATTTTSTTTTAAPTTTTTTTVVPTAVNTGSPLDSPVNLALIAVALGALVATGGAMLARRRV